MTRPEQWKKLTVKQIWELNFEKMTTMFEGSESK